MIMTCVKMRTNLFIKNLHFYNSLLLKNKHIYKLCKDINTAFFIDDSPIIQKEEYIKLLNTVSESNNYLFVCLFVTNVLENGTYVLFSDRAKETLESAFGIKNIKQGEFLKGIVSRKLQILPKLMNDMDQ